MKIELPLIEIEDYIKDNYGVDVKIKFADFNKIEVEYLFGIQIQVVEFTDYTVRFSYDLNWAANLIAKNAKFFTSDYIDSKILLWDTSNKTFKLNLIKIDALESFLNSFKIKDFCLKDHSLIIELSK